ncbi:hypothetical protein M3A96_08025 [Helcobacillus massiliensis]|uniref:Uncharacterized protein n=1 Tax=Helcobacillus massiliensis TaxID=521392 RepID=A0A839QUP6_9MICO|nr:hypothetical protein [Helcobacillus massiliensis]MBB3023802.1 hypothetical protein [Helcobacillus massiliensis]MCT1558060.1 hypothetical protein [Helcobacillus massiliensis]MCT2036641.1 hypothetical protein [Helcobacillus massiliensis]MCT2332485.1 hypothetical protein [Helcobacillus massiliensis]
MRTRPLTARLASVGAAAVLTISLAACGGSTTEGRGTEEPTTTPTITSPPKETSPAEEADAGDRKDASADGKRATGAKPPRGDDLDGTTGTDEGGGTDKATPTPVDPKDVPSKDEFSAYLVKELRTSAEEDGALGEMKATGITDEQFDRFFTCFSDEIYPHLSDEAKVAIMNGDTPSGEPPSDDVMMNALVTCGKDDPEMLKIMMEEMKG